MESKEGNKLIAEFMGGKRCGYPGGYFAGEYGYKMEFLNHGVTNYGGWYNEKNMLFHKSWDWLMIVCKKIADHLDGIERPSKNHCCTGDVLEVDIICAIREYDIQKTHAAVIEFIKWYNKQTSLPTDKTAVG